VSRRRLVLLAPLLLIGSGSLLLGRNGYLAAKAALAERLIDRAFAAHLTDGRVHRPWGWADTHPIAVLEVGRLGVRRIVLNGASGESLAFGAGHLDGTAPPNTPGNCVLAGHRDRAFAFLADLKPGDTLTLRTYGAARVYIVDGVEVVPKGETGVLDPTPQDRLTLLTCYPFGGLRRSPWRYVVTASAAGSRSPHPTTIS